MYNTNDWSNEPRQEQAVGQALLGAIAVSVILLVGYFTLQGFAETAEKIRSLF